MRKVIILGCIALLSLAALNLWMWRQLTIQRGEASALREQLARVQGSPSALAQSQPGPQPQSTHRRPATEKAPSAVRVGSISDPMGLMPGFGTDQSALFRDADYMRAWQTQMRATSEMMYPDVQRALKMTPDMTDRFHDLLVTHLQVRSEAMAASMRGERDNVGGDALVQKEQDEIAGLLGPARMKAWGEYQDGLEYRAEVNRLRVQIGGGPEGLRDDQVEALVSVYRKANEAIAQQHAGTEVDMIPSMEPFDPTNWGAANSASRERQKALNARILEEARALLDPAQFAQMERMIRLREELEEGGALMMQRSMQLAVDERARAASTPPN